MGGLKVGSLCTGYGGLDMAVEGETVWVSDIDKHARILLEHRFPTVPNLGDLTVIDWGSVEPVDIITAGYPCQPFSQAGKRDGTNDARHIWPHIANAIRILRPRFVFLENVAGHLSLGFGDVLGQLAEAGYDAEWVSVRASDVGAPHRRERVFILATDTERRRRWQNDPYGRDVVREIRIPGRRYESPSPPRSDPQVATDAAGDGRDEGRTESAGVEGRPNSAVRRRDATPDTEVNEQRESADGRQVRAESGHGAWGDYLPAVQRWQHLTERRGPNPTTPNARGRQRLNPRFVEWMMGLPEGWVTDVPGISRTGQLHLLGNGVVPQQAAYALDLLADELEGKN